MNTTMGIRWRLILTCALLVGVVAVHPIPVSPAQADWRDKVKDMKDKAKDKTEDAKEKWKEQERRCTECGKTIHVGTKCASCQSKAAKEKWAETKPKLKETADKARDTWQETSPKLRDVAQTTYDKAQDYAPKVRDAAKNIGDDLRQYGPRLREAAHTTRNRWETLKPEIQARRLKAADWYIRYEDLLAEKARDAMGRYGPAISRNIRDPENRQKAFEAIGTIIEVRRQLKGKQQERTYMALTLAFKLPVQTGTGTSTLGDLARDRLVQRFPCLDGTDITEDPAGPITALLINDRKYFLTEFQIVKSGHEYVSITKAIGRSSSFDTDKAMKCLDLMEATEGLLDAVNKGNGSLEAIENTISVIQTLNR